jgi:hypothetical protein
VKRRPFIALSADFFEDPDVDAVGPGGQLLYLQLACRIRQLHSDGFIYEVHVRRLGVPKWQTHMRALVDVGLVTEHTDANGAPAWYMPAYLKWNWSEEAWLRKEYEGKLWACKGRHRDPPPCDRESCRDAARWLDNHPKPAGSPSGSPSGLP